MAAELNEKRDSLEYESRGSDSDQPQQDEKHIARHLNDPLGVLHSVPDPDEGLSEEERQEIVCDPEAFSMICSH